MSTINSVGAAGSAWSDMMASRAGAMKDRMFAKVDGNGDGAVDKTELQTMLDKIAKKTGGTAADAGDMLGKMDSDGNGTLSKDELEAGMKSLMPPPSSTLDFAQQRGGAGLDLFSKLDADGSGGLGVSELSPLLDKMAAGRAGSGTASGDVSSAADAAVFKKLDTDGDGAISKDEFSAAMQKVGGGGGHHHGPPPAAAADAGSQASTGSTGSSSTAATDPLDTNGDGVVSAQERAAGALKDMVSSLLKAMDSNSDGNISKTEADSFQSQWQTALGTASLSGSSSAAPSGSSSGPTSGDAQSPSSQGSGRGGHLDATALARLVRQEYSQAAANAAPTPALSVAA
jgi:Ca2+-binding EF-hand superfamily protein